MISPRELSRVRDSIRDEARTPSSGYVYGTVVDYDTTTRLSIVEVLGEQITNVPKLSHVQMGGDWELISSGLTTSFPLDMPIPARNYQEITLSAWGNANGGSLASVAIYVNRGTIASNIHRYMRRVFFADGSNGAVASTAQDYWRVGDFNHTHENHILMRLVRTNTASEVIDWQSQTWLANNATGTSQQQLAWTSGVIDAADVEVTMLSFDSVAGNALEEVGWNIEGKLPSDPTGRQVLCVRDKLVPLTIIGTLSGATV